MATTRTEILRPPEAPGVATWLKKNLFSNWINSLLTVISLAFTLWALFSAIRWVFFIADWTPIVSNPLLYLVGQYPRGALWRLGIGLVLTSFLLGASWRKMGTVMRTFSLIFALFLLLGVLWPAAGAALTPAIRGFLFANLAIIGAGYFAGGSSLVTNNKLLVAWLVTMGLTLILTNGISGVSWLPTVPTGLWGGLLVTMILAIGGITLSFPIGVLLALGRRSKTLPVVSIFSTAFIEIIRGVPLIGLLFLFANVLPLFLPSDIRIDRLLRALVSMTIFSAAYMAENVRGGLAAVAPGQEEAAKALGLNPIQSMTYIVLPQALRSVIPPIVGQFISLFKDTTLAAGVAVLELLTVARSILQANPEYIGLQTEVYIFVAAVFWIFSYLMSYASQRLEVSLGVGER